MFLGKEIREQQFLFASEYVNLNQGSYGSYPRPVRCALRHWQDAAESNPDKFIRVTFPEKLHEIRHAVAQFLHADTDTIVLVPNATTGINTVLRNLGFQPGSKIAFFTGIYGAVAKTVDYLVETTPVESIQIDYDPLHDSDEDLIARFHQVIDANLGAIKVAIFDTVMSMPGVRMPFERLTEACRQRGVYSVIDGAHGIGLLDLDLRKLDADFLVTNCHKWLFVPRACAVFYVALRNQHLMRSSLPTSHGFVPLATALEKKSYFNPNPSSSQNKFVAQFEYTGTIDTAPILCIPAALDFRAEICGGERKIREYCIDLAFRGEYRIAELLGTEGISVPYEKRVAFANIRLPLSISESDDTNTPNAIPVKHVAAVINFMFEKFSGDYHTFINILYFSGALWARLSATVYLDMDDMIYGGVVLKQLCQRVEAGEYKSKLK